MKGCVALRFLLLLLAGALLASALSLAGEVPFLAGRVNDTAGILSATTVQELDGTLAEHERETSNQVAVLTIPSLEGESIEAYSMHVAETWKLGQKGKDNGVLLLVARDDRRVRIEVGSGLEGDLSDLTCGLIIRREILPRFKEGNYDAGVRAGVNAILAAVKGTYQADEQHDTLAQLWPKLIGISIFIVVVGIFTVLAMFTHGFQSWFLYVFLIPFWMAFPYALLGLTPGIILFAIYALGFPLFKTWAGRTAEGKKWQQSLASRPGFATFLAGSTTSGGGWSSGGGGFSGGGGGFSGGGASGSW